MAWTTDEFGNREWKSNDWTISVYPEPGKPDRVYCHGPKSYALEYAYGKLYVEHEAPYEGDVTAEVPVDVLLEYLKVKGAIQTG